MNRPDSDSLNSNAEATVAAKFFAKDIGGEGYKPSIANSFIPPVIDKGPEQEVKSPFKAAPKAPVKRPKNLNNPDANGGEDEKEAEVKKAPAGPQIARFMDIPIVEKPKSPFVPIGQQPQNESGLKAPVKRPASASVNHAAAKKEEEEREQIKKELDAMGGAFKPSPFAAKSAAAPAVKKEIDEAPSPFVPLKPQQKTFVPLAPIPVEEQNKKEEINPFAPRVEKTEEQIRREEENARRALEQSRQEPKKSRLDKIMDGLNKPIF